MKALTIIRSSEWWEYKMPVLLSFGYITAVRWDKSIYALAPWLGFLLLSIIVGAVYVSIINDLTDIEEDKASGKHNRLSKLSPSLRWILLSVSILAGAACAFFLAADALTLTMYLLSYLSFTLYSVPPFRLKKRGLAGVAADACGAHLFPSLTIIAGTQYYLQLPFDYIWFAAAGIWSLMYGLRGILWHQFLDRDNDRRIGLNTFATQRDPNRFKSYSIIILLIEIIALSIVLVYTKNIWPFIALFAYLLLATAYHKLWGIKLIAIVPPANRSWHIILSSYYQVFLPIALLLASSIVYPYSWLILGLHVFLFPKMTWNILVTLFSMRRHIV